MPAVELEGPAARCVVVLLEGLERAASLSGLLGDLCHNLDNRGAASPLLLSSGAGAKGLSLDVWGYLKGTDLFFHPSSFRRPPLPPKQLPYRHRVQAPPAGLRAPPPAALSLGDPSLGPGATARPSGKAPA